MQNCNSKFKIDIDKRTYNFALNIIDFIDSLDNRMSVQVIAKQLLRAATSVGANVAEAQASSSRREFANFMTYALKSANETKFWLNLLKDAKKCRENLILPLTQEIKELSNILASIILKLKYKN
ncbi:MAG: four helix bundle protein [Candidatus Omnitrophota bacterium]